MAGTEGLEAQPSRMRGTVPFLGRHFGIFEGLALDDRHLPPCAIEPNVPRNVAGRAAPAAVPFERVKAVVEGIIDLALDQSAAHP